MHLLIEWKLGIYKAMVDECCCCFFLPRLLLILFFVVAQWQRPQQQQQHQHKRIIENRNAYDNTIRAGYEHKTYERVRPQQTNEHCSYPALNTIVLIYFICISLDELTQPHTALFTQFSIHFIFICQNTVTFTVCQQFLA